jgi:hypothetical protein
MQEHEGPILTYESRIRNRELEGEGVLSLGGHMLAHSVFGMHGP